MPGRLAIQVTVPRGRRRLGASGSCSDDTLFPSWRLDGRLAGLCEKAVMQRYSIFSLARNALTGHRNWQAAWRSPEPKPAYDVVIVGAGGHGLATAYYLAKEHGITNVAVLERGWLGGGNTGRNTTICRSNYL